MIRRGILVALTIFTLAFVACTSQQKATTATLLSRMELFQPNGTGGWTPIDCSSGTASVSGVGNIRMLGYATWTGANTVYGTKPLRVLYGQSADGSKSWYSDVKPTLPPNVEVLAAEMVQDLNEGVPQDTFKFNTNTCVLNVSNLPAQSEGMKSVRSTYTSQVHDIRVEVFKYSDGTPVPCGAFTPAVGRVNVKLFATADVTGDYDFHVHQEVPADKSIGPDQDGNPANVRWWEMGFNDVHMIAGQDTQVGSVVTQLLNDPKPAISTCTFHFMQQHSPTQPFTELFCRFTTQPS